MITAIKKNFLETDSTGSKYYDLWKGLIEKGLFEVEEFDKVYGDKNKAKGK